MKIKKNKSLSICLIFLFTIVFLGWNVSSAEGASTVNEKSEAIIGHGIVEGIDPDKHQLTIKHEAIAAINWPAMTMAFMATEKLDISQFKVGTPINFRLEKSKDGQMVIIHVEKADNQKG